MPWSKSRARSDTPRGGSWGTRSAGSSRSTSPRAIAGRPSASRSSRRRAPACSTAIRRPLRGGRAVPWFAGMLLTMRTLAALRGAGLGLVRLLGRLGWLRRTVLSAVRRRVHPSVTSAFADELRPDAFVRAARLAADYEERTWTGIRVRCDRCGVRATSSPARRMPLPFSRSSPTSARCACPTPVTSRTSSAPTRCSPRSPRRAAASAALSRRRQRRRSFADRRLQTAA